MKSSTALLLCSLSAVSLWGWGGGQELAWSNNSEAPVKDQSCGQSPQHMRVSARYTSPKGVGYDQGYTTLETFLSPWDVFNDKWLPFVDGRGHIFDNGKWAANAGLGVRYLSCSRVWGINSYYDYRNTSRIEIIIRSQSASRRWGHSGICGSMDIFRLEKLIPVYTKQDSRRLKKTRCS